jgi:hypothetical protein
MRQPLLLALGKRKREFFCGTQVTQLRTVTAPGTGLNWNAAFTRQRSREESLPAEAGVRPLLTARSVGGESNWPLQESAGHLLVRSLSGQANPR